MKKQFDLVVFIGRFQGLHNAHKAIIDRAATMADKVLVIVGSADKPRTYKNPFTTDERKAMVSKATENLSCEIAIDHVYDITYNDIAWAAQVQKVVEKHIPNKWTDYPKKIGIIGHKKDETSFYLDMFPQWSFIEQPRFEPLNASQIRELYFTKDANMNFIKGVVPQSTVDFLEEFRTENESAYWQVIRERNYIDNYKKKFEHLPYAPTFVTTDAVVVQSGHVLMIRRKHEPGKGLLAFPGGFLNAKTDRSLMDCMIRELREETGLKVPEKVLKGSITNQKTYDAIERSSRGRVITTAFKIELKDIGALPHVKGMDDADKAFWIPISAVKRVDCFEDHYCILQDICGL